MNEAFSRNREDVLNRQKSTQEGDLKEEPYEMRFGGQLGEGEESRAQVFLRGTLSLLRELVRDKAALLGLIFFVILIVMALAAPLVAPHDPAQQDIRKRLSPPSLSGGYVLGTDQMGRDVLSRIIYGSRASLTVAISVVLFAGSIGVLLGVLAGYFGGRVDDIIMRLVDIQFSFPGLLISMTLIAVLGPSLRNMTIALGLNGWMVYARLARGVTMTLRRSLFIDSARAVGCPDRRIMSRHILPNLAAPLLTLAVLEWARIILAEAGLSFLGLGIQPPQSSWGLMIAEGRMYLAVAWWLVLFPSLAIAFTVLSINLFVSWLRVIADPYQRRGRG
jgi:peptide/nickel transport system permease protein